MKSCIIPLTGLLFLTVQAQIPANGADTRAYTVETPAVTSSNAFYTGNRAPLSPSPFVKLPIGSIKPSGWLRHQLELETEGMTGHLEEISKWCDFEKSAWATPDGSGEFGWEELPYWLKGFGDLGYVLNDPRIIKKARRWIDATLASQDGQGFFGPRANKTSLEGHPDLWPHMVMLNVLQSFHEYSGDARVIPFMTKYLRWLNQQPPATFSRGYWPKLRWGDTMESAHWLYNRTGEPFLLDLARKIHDNMARWDTGVINWHNVNIAQGFRAPGVFYPQGKDRRLLNAVERNYQTVMGLYGQFPGGGFGGDENCRPGFYDPRQGFETCGIVEFMHSFQMLTKISGETVWADRCEEMAFNSMPASQTPDQKALHYLTAANQVQLDSSNKAPAIENGGNMFAYSPGAAYRCCQHNVSHGWPYYAEELWLATPDNGLCASLYSASEVTAKVGNGASVTIIETTDYPFSDIVNFKVKADSNARFPLYLRIPRWCAEASIRVNGKALSAETAPATYTVIEREWSDGDTVELRLPMTVSVRKWEKNHDAVSIDYGPLTFSLKIGERWSRYGGTEKWPEYEVFPTTPWNYGLVLNEKHPAKSFKVVHKKGELPAQPFTPESAPIELRAKARKIPAWQQDQFGLVGKLQPGPAKSTEPVETISLIPMGAARLRISSFPVISDGPDAREWKVPAKPPVSASHCHASDTVEAMIDGLEPKTSTDQTIPRFTWWDHRGSREWAQRDFEGNREVSTVEVYWFDDEVIGGRCRVPESWKVLYKESGRWMPVETTEVFSTRKDQYNRVRFKPVTTSALRLEAKLQPEVSGGILEWKVQ